MNDAWLRWQATGSLEGVIMEGGGGKEEAKWKNVKSEEVKEKK